MEAGQWFIVGVWVNCDSFCKDHIFHTWINGLNKISDRFSALFSTFIPLQIFLSNRRVMDDFRYKIARLVAFWRVFKNLAITSVYFNFHWTFVKYFFLNISLFFFFLNFSFEISWVELFQKMLMLRLRIMMIQFQAHSSFR